MLCSFVLACEHEEPSSNRSERPEAAETSLRPISAESLRTTFEGRRERALLVNVWSTWCEPCVEEMPDLVRTARRYAPRGLGLVLISADPPSERPQAVAFLRSVSAPFPSYVKTGSDDAFVRALHPSWSGALPATLLLDGRRATQQFWEGRMDPNTLGEAIESLLSVSGEGAGP